MARRLPSQPPVLPGFTFVHFLGSGGFADVFLFEQNMPRRQVAVKVLLREVVNDRVRNMFQTEANLMAQLSSHPAVLTVYQAGVSSDGRPYLVMEFCSSALADRYRKERIPVAEVLKVAIKIGGAIETAHRIGVLHRDIKPSNILLTSYGHPVLSDFGIAASVSRDPDEDSVGLSIPWSAPEVLQDESGGSIASEVWAFAATVYSLLAGRSPFEKPGGDNSSAALIERISRARPMPIGRDDVPEELEQFLRRAMSKRPSDRPSTMLEVISELQLIEVKVGMPQTDIEVAVDDWALAPVENLEERTRVRGVASVQPQTRRRRRIGTETELEQSRGSRSGASSRSSSAVAQPARSRWVWPAIVALLVVAVVAVLVVEVIVPGIQTLTAKSVPKVTNISGQLAGRTITFSWPDPGISSDDLYSVQVGSQPASLQSTNEFSYTISSADGSQVCIQVSVVSNGRAGAPSNPKCVETSQG